MVQRGGRSPSELLVRGARSETRWLAGWIGLSSVILFGCSSVRHLLFQSTAFDLGYFDQATYLISQGQVPIVSFWGFHFLGGHADWIMYPIALLYRLVPSVFWLLEIQAIALALGALPTYFLGLQAGVKPRQALAIAGAYLLYPLIFNLNLFDFHPEVIALPLILAAIWAARQQHLLGFVVCVVISLGCRDALSLTIAAMGLWLGLFERRRLYGAIALLLGVAWFLLATQWLIPQFRPAGVESVTRFAYLGATLPKILVNLILKPQVVLSALFTVKNLEYLVLLFAPLAWGLSWRHLAPLVAAIPPLAMNLLSTMDSQKDLLHQYSLPILPFMVVAAIAAVANQHSLLQNPRRIWLWALVGFLALAKFGYFGDRYLNALDTWQATRTALTQAQPTGSILTTAWIVPHVTHRPTVKVTMTGTETTDLGQFDHVLLNLRHPGWMSTPETQRTLLTKLEQDSRFTRTFAQDDVYLFMRR